MYICIYSQATSCQARVCARAYKFEFMCVCVCVCVCVFVCKTVEFSSGLRNCTMPARILDVKGRQNVFKWYFDHGLSVSNIALKLNGCATDGAPLAGEDFISKRSLRRLVLQFCKNGDWSMDKRLRTFKQVPEAVLSALRQVVDERPSGYTSFFSENVYYFPVPTFVTTSHAYFIV